MPQLLSRTLADGVPSALGNGHRAVRIERHESDGHRVGWHRSRQAGDGHQDT
jgi:hypothetical protein